MAFHRERSRGEEIMPSKDAFTFRDIVISINTHENIKNRFHGVLTSYGMRYPDEVRAVMISLLATKDTSPSCPRNRCVRLEDFRDCFHHGSITEILRGALFAFGNGRGALRIGEERPGLA
jgi:hypothetical protein